MYTIWFDRLALTAAVSIGHPHTLLHVEFWLTWTTHLHILWAYPINC